MTWFSEHIRGPRLLPNREGSARFFAARGRKCSPAKISTTQFLQQDVHPFLWIVISF